MRHLALVFILIASIGCNTNSSTNSKVITPKDQVKPTISLLSATDLKANGIKSGQILIDVRTPEEIADGKISGAQEIDFMAPDFKAQIGALDKSKDYVMYCRSGGRSGKAAELMIELGFTNVTNVTGGFMEYSK